jgi:hypothetical protein
MENSKIELLNRLRATEQSQRALQERKNEVEMLVGKPDKTSFFRTHPDHCFKAAMIESQSKEIYLVTNDIAIDVAMATESVVFKLFRGHVNQIGTYGIWPIKYARGDERLDGWNLSAQDIALQAETEWVRLVSNLKGGEYKAFPAQKDFGEPKWPVLEFPELVSRAFGKRVVDTIDHPVVLALKGLRLWQ